MHLFKSNLLYLITLITIVAIAFFVRFVSLSTLPPGLTWDEAALGYNAYSILKTGRDEHGVFMPLIFKSFGDYKPGLYVYLTVPFVSLLGLNEVAVRLPSVIAGTLSVLFLCLLVNQLFKNRTLGLFTAFALALMPWHIHFSRGAWETNVYVFFVILATYLFLKAQTSNRSVLPSILVFVATLYLYQAAKLITPLYLIGLFIFNRLHQPTSLGRFIRKEKPKLIFYVILFALVAFYIYDTSTGLSGNRLSRLSLFNYRPTTSDSVYFHSVLDQWWRMVSSRYLNHFSSELLFSGKVQVMRDTLGKIGMLHLVDGFAIFAGLVFLITNPFRRASVLILYLLLISPLGGSLTLSEFSTVRSLVLVIPLAMLIGFGLYYLSIRFSRLIFIPIFLVYAHFAVLDTDIYLNHSGRLLAEGFNNGHKEAVAIIQATNPDKIAFTDVYGQPYIYYLFYTQYDPAKFQKLRSFKDGGVDVGFVPGFANVEFRQPQYGDLINTPNSIFVGTYDNFPDSFDFKKDYIDSVTDVKDLSEKIVFRVIKTSKK